MDEKSQALKDDIAFMRDMAQAGASAPLVSGMILAVVGALFGAVSIVHWLWFRLGEPQTWMIVTLWLGAAAVCWGSMYMVFLPKMLKKPGVASPANQAVGFTWHSTGWTINTLLACTLILSWRLDSSLPFTVFPSVIAAVYGGAWMVSHKMARQGWMRWPMLGSFAFALLLSLMIDSPYLWLVFAAAFFLTVLAPGIVMMRREPSLVV
jgi:hypothetical protein